MNYVPLGTTGLRVSEISFGIMTFGNEADEATSRALLDRAVDVGINFFDGAHNYNHGKSEEILGRWMGSRRDQLIITSKIYFPGGGGMNDQRLSRRNLILSVEKSLKRLQTDYIDLLYFHHWDEETDPSQTMAAIDTLVRQGKVIYCGVSNFAAWQTMALISVSRQHGYPPIVCTQPMYNLVKRQAEVEILPLAAHEHLAVVPYSPTGSGLLTGKFFDAPHEEARIKTVAMYQQRYENPEYWEIARKFVEFAKARGQSPAALAIAWVMSHPHITSTILGARNMSQFEENLKCLEIRLTPEERAEISALSYTPPRATDRESMDAMLKRGW